MTYSEFIMVLPPNLNQEIVFAWSPSWYFKLCFKFVILDIHTLSYACYYTLTSLHDLASQYGIYGGQNDTGTSFPQHASVLRCQCGVYGWLNDAGTGFSPNTFVFRCQYGIYDGKNDTRTGFSFRVLLFSPVILFHQFSILILLSVTESL